MNFWVSIYQGIVLFAFPIYLFKSAAHPAQFTTIMFTGLVIVEIFNFYSCTYKMYFRHYLTFSLSLMSYFGLFWAMTPEYDVATFTWTIILEGFTTAIAAWLPI